MNTDFHSVYICTNLSGWKSRTIEPGCSGNWGSCGMFPKSQSLAFVSTFWQLSTLFSEVLLVIIIIHWHEIPDISWMVAASRTLPQCRTHWKLSAVSVLHYFRRHIVDWNHFLKTDLPYQIHPYTLFKIFICLVILLLFKPLMKEFSPSHGRLRYYNRTPECRVIDSQPLASNCLSRGWRFMKNAQTSLVHGRQALLKQGKTAPKATYKHGQKEYRCI